MKYWIDFEFTKVNDDNISVGVVAEDGRELYLVRHDYLSLRKSQNCTDWVKENVLPLLFKQGVGERVYPNVLDLCLFGEELREFISLDPDPLIIADSAVDVYRFCQAYTTSSDGTWCSSNKDKMTFEVRNVDCYPTTLPGAIQHHALWDARALKAKLEELKYV